MVKGFFSGANGENRTHDLLLREMRFRFSTFLNFLIFALNKAYFKGFFRAPFLNVTGLFQTFLRK